MNEVSQSLNLNQHVQLEFDSRLTKGASSLHAEVDIDRSKGGISDTGLPDWIALVVRDDAQSEKRDKVAGDYQRASEYCAPPPKRCDVREIQFSHEKAAMA